MSSGIMMPQKKPGMMQQVLPIAGSIVGAAYGGPAGGVVGGKVGEEVAGQQPAPAPVTTRQQPFSNNTPAPSPGQAPVASNAMQRRMSTMEPPPDQLAQADQALAQMPPEYQQQYGPIIRRARAMQGGMA